MSLNIVSVMGMNVLNDDLSKINFDEKILINTISPNSYGISTNDKDFKKALTDSLTTLDGEFFGLASILLKGITIKKSIGFDNFRCFMAKLNEQNSGGKAFFLGSTDSVLNKMLERAKVDYPNVEIRAYSPPYKPEFSEADNQKMVSLINEFEPQLLCVGLTAPKQEKWAYAHYKGLNCNVTITIGQVFDWYAGTMEEPNPIWGKLHLLWLIRTIKRPEILKRYPMVFKFAWYLFLNIIRVRKD